MKLLRRDFLRLGVFQAVSAGFIGRAGAAEVRAPRLVRSGFSILQGATDDTRTQFSIVHPADTNLTIRVGSLAPDNVVTKTFTGMTTSVTRAFFSGLTPNQDFNLVITNSSTGAILDTRVFRTIDLTKGSLRFALCSCMDDSKHEPKIWHDVVDQCPDVIFFIGDSVYSDQDGAKGLVPKPARLWRRFSEARQTLEIFYSPRLIPIIATWDDHDFGGNDAYSNYKYITETQENFLTFFAQEMSHCSVIKKGPGVASAVTLAGQLFLLMDDRSFRLRKGSGDRYAHWGKEQEEWALSLARAHQGPTWFFSGSQIFPAMIFKESVSGDHRNQLKGLKSELAKIQSKVVFGSGDVHFSEISLIEPEAVGYQTYELTSSGLHSDHIPGAPGIIPNNRRIESTGEYNYLLVDAIAQGVGVKMSVSSRSKNGKVNFNRDLAT